MSRSWVKVRSLTATMLVVALVPAAPAAGQAPSPSPSAVPSPGLDAVLADALDVELTGLTSPEAVSEAARELVALDRERLAAIDPGLPAALEERDAATEGDLAAWLATVLPPPEAEASPAPSPLAGPSPAASGAPEGRSGSAFLAARGPRVPDHGRTFDQGGSYLSSVGQVAGMVAEYVASTKPDKGSSRDPAAPFVRGDTRFEVRNARVRDTVTIGLTISETYEVPSRTPGQPAITVTDSGEATVIVDVCPDEDGTVVATATTSATVDAAGNGLGYRVVADADDRAVATVNGEANVASVAHSGTASRHATGDRAVFASGGEGSAESHLEGSTSWTTDGSGGAASPASVEIGVADGANEADIRAWVLTRALAASLTDQAITAAAQVWRGGRCLELKPDPPGQVVDPGSETGITVTIEHKAYDEEVERPIRATFAGVEGVEPLETPVEAPADFTFRAANEPRTEGTITWRTVSDRGIAERSETYRVEARLLLDVDMRVDFAQGPVRARGTVKARGLRVTPIAADPTTAEPPGVTVEGDLDFRGRARSPGCAGAFRGAFPVDPAKDASATITGEGEDRRLAVRLRLADASAELTARIRCEGGSVDLPIPLGSLLPPITVELPLAGGSLTGQGNESGARWKATYTLRAERPG